MILGYMTHNVGYSRSPLVMATRKQEKVKNVTWLTSQLHHALARNPPYSSYLAHMFLQYVEFLTFQMMHLWTPRFVLQKTYPHIRRPLCQFRTCLHVLLGQVRQLFRILQLNVERDVRWRVLGTHVAFVDLGGLGTKTTSYDIDRM